LGIADDSDEQGKLSNRYSRRIPWCAARQVFVYFMYTKNMITLMGRLYHQGRRYGWHFSKVVVAVLPLLCLADTCGAAPSSKPKAQKAFKGASVVRERHVGSAHITPITRNAARSKTLLTLAANGKAALPLSFRKASDATKAVAAELAEYLKRISGATLKSRPAMVRRASCWARWRSFPPRL
jgi:hypothetical protein